MQAFYCDHFVLPLPDGHRFPMVKYARLRACVQAAGFATLHEPAPAETADLARAHTADYITRVYAGTLTPAEVRRLGFPWSPHLVERARRSVGGTLAACRAACTDGLAANLAGGTHHAFHDHGAGYCVFNDSAVAARTLQAEGRARRVVILDCDVHQGDGTAAIFADDPSVCTFSIHGAKNFPFHKQRSTIDIELPDGTTDDAYLSALEDGVRRALALAGADFALYVAGADPYQHDTLGRLALTQRGLLERDRLVLGHCRAAGLPVALSMAGGYARDIEDTVAIHLQTLRTAAEMCA